MYVNLITVQLVLLVSFYLTRKISCASHPFRDLKYKHTSASRKMATCLLPGCMGEQQMQFATSLFRVRKRGGIFYAKKPISKNDFRAYNGDNNRSRIRVLQPVRSKRRYADECYGRVKRHRRNQHAGRCVYVRRVCADMGGCAYGVLSCLSA